MVVELAPKWLGQEETSTPALSTAAHPVCSWGPIILPPPTPGGCLDQKMIPVKKIQALTPMLSLTDGDGDGDGKMVMV